MATFRLHPDGLLVESFDVPSGPSGPAGPTDAGVTKPQGCSEYATCADFATVCRTDCNTCNCAG